MLAIVGYVDMRVVMCLLFVITEYLPCVIDLSLAIGQHARKFTLFIAKGKDLE